MRLFSPEGLGKIKREAIKNGVRAGERGTVLEFTSTRMAVSDPYGGRYIRGLYSDSICPRGTLNLKQLIGVAKAAALLDINYLVAVYGDCVTYRSDPRKELSFRVDIWGRSDDAG